jgi:DNA-binding FrmR family transcriptional regulator
MDKKAKKRVEVLQTRLHKLQLQLAGARKQLDDPEEIPALERQVSEVAAELERLKSTP